MSSKTDSPIWVKASERLPEERDLYVCRCIKKENGVTSETVTYGEYRLTFSTIKVDTDKYGEVIEWLDESLKEDQQPSLIEDALLDKQWEGELMKQSKEQLIYLYKRQIMFSNGLRQEIKKDQQPSGDAIEFAEWILSEHILPRDTNWFDAGKHLSSKELYQMFKNTSPQPIKEDAPAGDDAIKEIACDFFWECRLDVQKHGYQEVRKMFDSWLSANEYHKNKLKNKVKEDTPIDEKIK